MPVGDIAHRLGFQGWVLASFLTSVLCPVCILGVVVGPDGLGQRPPKIFQLASYITVDSRISRSSYQSCYVRHDINRVLLVPAIADLKDYGNWIYDLGIVFRELKPWV